MTPPAAAVSAGATPRGAARAARAPVPARPRRVSGPARRGARHELGRSRPRRRGAPLRSGAARALLALRGLPDTRLLDRLIRGRVSIAVVAFALMGIVTLQLGLLKLNSSIARTLQRQALLQRDNAALSVENSNMATGEGVEAGAQRLGMQLVPDGALRFLSAAGSEDIARAAAALRGSSPAANGAGAQATGQGSAGAGAAGAETSAGAAGAPTAAAQAGSAPGQAEPAPGEAGSAPGEARTSGGQSPSGASEAPASVQQTPSAPAGQESSGGQSGGAQAGGAQAAPAG